MGCAKLITKLRNISYNGVVKAVMFILLVLVVTIATKDIIQIKEIYKLQNNNEYALKSYSKYEGKEDYYYEYSKVSYQIYNAIIGDAKNLYDIVIDNGQHSMHEVLNLDIDKYIEKGIRYILTDDDGRTIATDGITNINTNYLDWYNDITCTENNIYFDNNDVSQLTNNQISQLRSVIGVDCNLNLYIKYDDKINDSVQSYVDKSYSNNANIIVYICVILLILLYFFIVAGQSEKNGEVKYMFLDKIYFDILLIIICFALYIYLLCFLLLDLVWIKNQTYQAYQILFLISSICCTITVFIICNMSKKLKNKDLLNSCFIVLCFKYIYRKLYTFTNKTNFKLFCILSIISFFIILSMPFMIIFFMPFYILFIVSSIKLVDSISKVKNREPFANDKKIMDILFSDAFENLEEINLNLDNMYKQGLKVQNMQTELITNVSHDLRTPLTSIIGYVDLLDKKSYMLDEETKEYINIIRKKSNRMNEMVQDLFDLSKSASGNVELNTEKINVKKLIEQTLSEFDDIAVQDSDIVVKLDDSLYINVDGSKMFRVMQNIIGNALKYSMEGTRIYISAYRIDKNNVIIEVKNIANYNMNFTGEDVIERFVRGDVSRTSEGNGLGLSIAKSYTNINNGNFKIIIDGDLFKVQIKFMCISLD